MPENVDRAFDPAATDVPGLFLDSELRVSRFTDGIGAFLSLAQDDCGRAVAEVAGGTIYESLARDARRAMEEPTTVERVVERTGGAPVLVRVLPNRNGTGEIVGASISFVHHGDRSQMEAELLESNTLAATIVETLHEPIVVLTSHLHVAMVNPAFYRHFRVAPEDTIGHRIYDLGNGQWDIPELRELLEKVLPSDQAFQDFDVRHRFDGLGERHMLINARRLDHIQKILLGIRDITERERLEDRVRKRQKMEAIGRFAGGVAHDFNNLLTAANGYASILEEELPPDSPFHEEVEGLLQIGRRAGDLTRQLLAFSRDQVLDRRPVDLGGVTGEAESMLLRLVPERLRLEIQTTEDPVTVHADPVQIRQVLANLVINAAKATEDGGRIDIEVGSVEVNEKDAEDFAWSVEPGRYGRLTVRDTGRGMAPDVQDRIFEPFFTTKDTTGTGLGLSAVFGIVKQHDGHVLVESVPGRGSTFDVLLPRISEPSVDRGSAADTSIGRVRPAPGDRTVLLVEDEETVRRVTRRMLERAGYGVVEASTGREALKVLDGVAQDPDMIVSDVVMPELDGVEFAEALRARSRKIPIIFMSGYSEKDLHSRVQDLGTAFLQKPFTRDELLGRLAKVLAESG